MQTIPQVLTIAGVDSSGGAGVNADLRTFDLLDTYSATVITGLTAQNTQGVHDVLATPVGMLKAQLTAVLDDLDIRAIKTGALFNASVVATVGELLTTIPDAVPVIVDPVMVAKGGASLLDADAVQLLRTLILPRTYLLTPNLLEAEALTGVLASDRESMLAVAQTIQAMGPQHVLLKGGHGQGEQVEDLLLLADGQTHWYSAPRYDTKRTHGTGDTLSAYLTAGLAHGYTLPEVMPAARQFMSDVIRNEIAVGHGHGPLNHWAGVGGKNGLKGTTGTN